MEVETLNVATKLVRKRFPAGDTICGLQHLRAIAALAVVAFHAGGSVASAKYQGNETIGVLTRGFDSGVDLFFVVSGFVIALPLFTGKPISVGRYLYSRATRVYPMAMLTALIYIVFGMTLAGVRYDDPLLVALTSAFLIPSVIEPVPIVLWTLKQEVLFYAIFASTFLNARAGLALVGLWGLASLAFTPSDALGRWFLHVQNVEFLFGVCACALWTRVCLAPPSAAAVAFFAAIAFLLLTVASAVVDTGPRIEVLAFGAMAATLVYAMACLPIAPAAILTFLGAASYSIYLIHFFFVSAANKILAHVPVPDWAAFFVLSAAAVSGGVVYYLIAERPLETLRKRLEARLFPMRARHEPAVERRVQ